MFCKNCGKEIDDKAAVCIHCGVPTANNQPQQVVVTTPPTNTFAIVGFVLSLLGGSLISLILSIIGLKKSRLPEYCGNGKGFAVAGIILSSLALFGIIITIGVCASIGCAAAGQMALVLPLV